MRPRYALQMDGWLTEGATTVKTIAHGEAARTANEAILADEFRRALAQTSHCPTAAGAEEGAAAAEELNASFEEVTGTSGELAAAAEKLQTLVGRFKVG